MDKQQQEKLIAAAKQAIATYEAAGNVEPEPEYLTLFKVALASLEAEPAVHGGWIKCTERLPESEPYTWSKPVAAISNLGDVFQLKCMGDYWQRSAAFVDSGAQEITHWMPLPDYGTLSAPPAPVVKVPDCFVSLHEEIKNRYNGRMPKEVQDAFDACAELLRLNDNSAPGTDNTEEQYHSISREKRGVR